MHTTVRVPGGKYIEVQIRTEEMHERSELGIAAHWRYKEGGGADDADLADMVKWLRQIMEWQAGRRRPARVHGEREDRLLPGRGLRLQPRRRPLPAAARRRRRWTSPSASTPRSACAACGAKVNGRIVPPAHAAAERRQGGDPHRARRPPGDLWLQIVKTAAPSTTSGAGSRRTQFDGACSLGREILERELRRARSRCGSTSDLVDVAQQMGYRRADKLLAAVGQRRVSRGSGARPACRRARASPAEKVLAQGPRSGRHAAARALDGGVRVAGRRTT